MKPRSTSALFFTVAILGAIAFLTGCASSKTGIARAERTTDSMESVEKDYREISTQIDATGASLENLMKPEQSDLKGAFSTYTGNVEKMEELSKRLETRTEQMRTRGEKYFAEWESSYTSPEIRQISEQRRLELRRLYSTIPEASVGVKGALNDYMRGIRDIRTYLSNDLTPKGVDSMRPIAQTAVTDGERVKERVKPVLSTLDQVKGQMTPGAAK